MFTAGIVARVLARPPCLTKSSGYLSEPLRRAYRATLGFGIGEQTRQHGGVGRLGQMRVETGGFGCQRAPWNPSTWHGASRCRLPPGTTPWSTVI